MVRFESVKCPDCDILTGLQDGRFIKIAGWVWSRADRAREQEGGGYYCAR